MRSAKCKICNKEFLYYEKTNSGKFCSRSCSASYNNTIRVRISKVKKASKCRCCNKDFLYNPKVSRGYYCSLKCSSGRKVQNDERYKLFLLGKLHYRGALRKFVLKKQGHICSICKNTTWNGAPIPLWLDHIDGNASNNLPSNLRMLCLNCDAQGNTFGNKNKGKGRRSLGLKPWA